MDGRNKYREVRAGGDQARRGLNGGGAVPSAPRESQNLNISRAASRAGGHPRRALWSPPRPCAAATCRRGSRRPGSPPRSRRSGDTRRPGAPRPACRPAESGRGSSPEAAGQVGSACQRRGQGRLCWLLGDVAFAAAHVGWSRPGAERGKWGRLVSQSVAGSGVTKAVWAVGALVCWIWTWTLESGEAVEVGGGGLAADDGRRHAGSLEHNAARPIRLCCGRVISV